MSALTIEDLAKLINKPPAKKPRKKTERTAKQEEEMKERMKLMREKSLEARKKKAEGKNSALPLIENKIDVGVPQAQQTQVQQTQAQLPKAESSLFEKQYANKLDKLDESMGHIKESLTEMKQMKLEKAERRKKEKEEEQAKKEVKSTDDTLEKKSLNQPINEVVQTPTQQQVPNGATPYNPNKIAKNTNYKTFFKR